MEPILVQMACFPDFTWDLCQYEVFDDWVTELCQLPLSPRLSDLLRKLRKLANNIESVNSQTDWTSFPPLVPEALIAEPSEEAAAMEVDKGKGQIATPAIHNEPADARPAEDEQHPEGEPADQNKTQQGTLALLHMGLLENIPKVGLLPILLLPLLTSIFL